MNTRFVIFALVLSAPGLLFASSFFELEASFAKRAKDSVLSISLRPKAPWKISQDAPISLDSNGRHYSKEDAKVASENEIRFELPAKSILEIPAADGVLRFYLCSDKGCRKFEEKLQKLKEP